MTIAQKKKSSMAYFFIQITSLHIFDFREDFIHCSWFVHPLTFLPCVSSKCVFIVLYRVIYKSYRFPHRLRLPFVVGKLLVTSAYVEIRVRFVCRLQTVRSVIEVLS